MGRHDGRGTNRSARRIARLCGALLLALLLLLAGAGAEAQTRPFDNSETGQISGRVTDAETREPLAGVTVRLDRAGARAGLFRSAVTDGAGEYRFEEVPAGPYRIRVERIGYLARVVEIDLLPGDRPSIGIALQIRPIPLPALEIAGPRRQSFLSGGDGSDDLVSARVDVARLRQARYLAADVRTLTQADVQEAVTLGEPDIFRALQRTPGVTTRDDYTATLWTRGATWDQTRVFLDGLPLYNPTHAGWLFSAVNPDAIGEVSIFPGYRSARWGEGTAAVLDMRSRRGGSRGPFSGVAELSPASARLALDGTGGDGRFRWMVAGRRTHVDFLTRAAELVADRDDLEIPYDFTDLIGRVDGEMDGWGFEASGIFERDRLRGDVPGLISGNTGRWGNIAGRGTLRLPVGAWRVPLPGILPDPGMGDTEARLTVGATRFETGIQEQANLTTGRGTIPAIENLILHRVVELEIAPTDRERGRWAMGAQAVWDTLSYRGPVSILSELAAQDTTNSLTVDVRLFYAALWAERRFAPTRRLTLDVGLRGEFGDSVRNGGYFRLAPRLASRFAIGPSTTLSAGWSRAYQYTQDASPAAGPIGPQLHLSALWVLAQRSSVRPAARSDLSTLGVEHWLRDSWLLGGTLFHRRATGLLIPNPEPGVVAGNRSAEGVGTNEAMGLDLSVRKLAGSWTGSLSYSFGRSEIEATVQRDGEDVTLRFPSGADVRHAVDLTGMTKRGRWGFGGALTFGSGVPFTELLLPDTSIVIDGERAPPVLGAPNAERTGSYLGLDLMADYSRTVGDWQLSVYAQLRNALNRDNAVTYVGSRQCGGIAGGALASLRPREVSCDGATGGIVHSFESGLPRFPLLGVRIAF